MLPIDFGVPRFNATHKIMILQGSLTSHYQLPPLTWHEYRWP